MWGVVINPVAGRGQGAISGAKVCSILKNEEIPYEIISGLTPISTSEHLRLFLERSTGIEGIIAVGGDGLVHLVLQQTAGRSIPFLVIPAGTGNDFARTLGWLPNESNFERNLLTTALKEPPTYIDLGLVDSEWFGAILSTGFDSIVNEKANSMKWPKGPMKYNVAMLQEIIKFRPRRYSITLKDQHIDTEAMLIAIGNGRSYGGGMKVCPDASLQDGLFDIMILKPISTVEFLKVFPKVYSGSHTGHYAVEFYRSSRIQIEAEAVAYADGEKIGSLPIVAECVTEAGLTWMR